MTHANFFSLQELCCSVPKFVAFLWNSQVLSLTQRWVALSFFLPKSFLGIFSRRILSWRWSRQQNSPSQARQKQTAYLLVVRLRNYLEWSLKNCISILHSRSRLLLYTKPCTSGLGYWYRPNCCYLYISKCIDSDYRKLWREHRSYHHRLLASSLALKIASYGHTVRLELFRLFGEFQLWRCYCEEPRQTFEADFMDSRLRPFHRNCKLPPGASNLSLVSAISECGLYLY